jgi:cation diffusion facilitator family transporter
MPTLPANVKNVPKLEARAAAISLGVGMALMLAKFAAFFLTGSAAIFSDALESIVNVAAAAFATYSLFLAHQPADADHPYGHGKIEFMSAGFEGGMVLLAAIVAAIQALVGLVRGSPDLQSGRLVEGLLLIACTVIVNAGLGAYLIRIGRRQQSLALEADGHHLISDVWSGVFALAGVGAVKLTGWRWADPLAGIAVAVFISRTGIRLIRRSAAGLMDEQDQDDSRTLQQLLDSHVGPNGKEPRICSYHKLRHRHSGRYHWVDFHLVLPADWDIARGHQVATTIEDEIEQTLREGNATSHIEPCIHPDCRQCQAAEVKR